MAGLGTTELIIVMVIVIILFGAGRIGKVAGELGSSIKAFREGMNPEDEQEVEENQTED